MSTTEPPRLTEQQSVDLIESSMREAGVPTEATVFADYFGTDTRHRTMLPDGVSWVEHKELTEGERKKIQNESNRAVRLHKVTGDASIQSRPGDERHALLVAAITGWNLRSKGEEMPFSTRALQKFLEAASPKVIDLIQKDIYRHNPWLMQDLSVEDIDKQIAELQEMREVKLKEEEGKAS